MENSWKSAARVAVLLVWKLRQKVFISSPFFTTETTRQESNGLIFYKGYIKGFCQEQCLVCDKKKWLDKICVRGSDGTLGLWALFNMQVSIPLEMHCE